MQSGPMFAFLWILLLTVLLELLIFWQWRKRKKGASSRKTFSFTRPGKLEIHRRDIPLTSEVPSQVVLLNSVRPRAPRWLPVKHLPTSVENRVARIFSALEVHWQADMILFSAALVLYLATRLIGLGEYPVYFNGDEAIHTVYAEQLIRDEGMFENRIYLPTYFKNGAKYNLSLSVYLQVLPALLFGKSVFVTRATSILVTLIPAAAIAWIVRDFLKLPYWWTATLLLSVVPVWFLHSRTAFETVLAVSMYAGFLYFYLRYRLIHPNYLYVALIFGALTFYAYSPAQLVIVACGFLLLILDFRYHLKHGLVSVGGLALLVILILPYLRFRLQVPDAVEAHLRDLGSFWLSSQSFPEKLRQFFSLYGNGLSPGYWYDFNQQDLPRHQMGEYGNILRIMLPFALMGLLLAFRAIVPPSRLRSLASVLERRGKPFGQTILTGLKNFLLVNVETNPRITYRTILLALLIAPLPATLAQTGNTRVLTFIIPATILTTAGLIALIQWLERQLPLLWPDLSRSFQPVLSTSVFLFLGLGLALFTADAIRNGPLWYQNYGFSGMQYGAPYVFDKIKKYLASYNSIQVVLTPDWANNSDYLTAFFLNDPYDIEMFGAESLLIADRTLMPNHVVILTAEEYAKIRESNKFKSIQVLETLNYPNGKPGFYFLHLEYIDNLVEILNEEREARRVLVEGTLHLDGQTVQTRYSAFDIGEIALLFDGDDETFVRTAEANPAVLELTFSAPRPLQEIALVIGAEKTQIMVQITTQDGQFPPELIQIVDGRELPREKVINFGATYNVQTLRIEVLLVETGEPAHVHLWDLWLR